MYLPDKIDYMFAENDELNILENQALQNLRLNLIRTSIIIFWLTLGVLFLAALFLRSFTITDWILLLSSVVAGLIVIYMPWNRLLQKKHGFDIAFSITALFTVFISLSDYFLHKNTSFVFPFILITFFSAFFYSKIKYLILVGLISSGLVLSMISNSNKDVMIVELIGILAISFVSNHLSKLYRQEVVSGFSKSIKLSEKIGQLEQINKMSMLLTYKFSIDEFIFTLIDLVNCATSAKNVIYISIENDDFMCYCCGNKNKISKDFKESILYKNIVAAFKSNNNIVELPSKYLNHCAELEAKNNNNDCFNLSSVSYQDQVYGALIYWGDVKPEENMAILETISNHAGIGIFKRNILNDIEESNKALEHKDEDRRKILQQLLTVQEDERKRISRELHDEIGQTLNSLLISLEMAYKKGTKSEIKDAIEIAINESEGAIYEIGNIIWSLRPTILDDLGLESALRSLTKRYDRLGLSIIFKSELKLTLTGETETVLYRISQEALNNIIKHSQAKNAYIELLNTDNSVKMLITDDGVGFKEMLLNDSFDPKSTGLIGIRERLFLINGSLNIQTNENGSKLEISIPISNREKVGNYNAI